MAEKSTSGRQAHARRGRTRIRAGTKPGKEVIEILTTDALDGKAVKDADKLLLTCNP